MTTDNVSDDCVTAAGFLSAAANPKRLAILRNLIEREFSVNELADCVDLSQYSSSAPSVKMLLAAFDESLPKSREWLYDETGEIPLITPPNEHLAPCALKAYIS